MTPKILTKKLIKKIRKIIFCPELSEVNSEPTFRIHQKNRGKRNQKIIIGSEFSEQSFRLHQKMTKNREKNSKIIFGSELSEANDEPTFRIHQKIEKKIEKIIFG